jgi:hypothetical protein
MTWLEHDYWLTEEWIESLDEISPQAWDEYIASGHSEELSQLLSDLESRLERMLELLNKGDEWLD